MSRTLYLHGGYRLIFRSPLAFVACIALWSGGCSITMEDGYKPRSLNATPEVRHAYYAPAFTDQADAATRVRGEEGPRRPGQ